MFKTNTFESRLGIVQNALRTSTRKPTVPSDRTPRLYHKATPSNQCINLGFQAKTDALDKDLAAHRLWKSMIFLLGNFLEKSPEADKFARSDLREFITQMEICLGVREGKLNASEFGNALIKFDTIAPYVDGEKHNNDVSAIEQAILAYGAKLPSNQ